jgi:type IV pilus assembly protein PilX
MSVFAKKVSFASHQKGVVLIVGLLVVLLAGILSLAAIRGSGMQEAMAGNMRNHNVAFQSAESALRDGENFVLNTTPLPAFNGASGRYQELPPANSVLLFTAANWVDPARVVSPALNLSAVAAQPTYVIEALNSDTPKAKAMTGSGTDANSPDLGADYYRVTARGVGLTNDSVVILQSNVRLVHN